LVTDLEKRPLICVVWVWVGQKCVDLHAPPGFCRLF